MFREELAEPVELFDGQDANPARIRGSDEPPPDARLLQDLRSAALWQAFDDAAGDHCGLPDGNEPGRPRPRGRPRAVRSVNPLLSSLRLADGLLTVYDLERLDEAPHNLVLSACEAGLSAAHHGDELMGWSPPSWPWTPGRWWPAW